VNGFPGWSYFASIVHGMLVLPLLLGLAANVRVEALDVDAFLRGPAPEAARRFLQHAHCCIIGYLLKDYTSLYPNGLESGYVLHHLVSIAGCALCLLMPMGLGLTTFNGIQCEFASALYSLRLALPSKFTKTLYYVGMCMSNILGAVLAYELFSYPLAASWRVTYAVLAAVLIALRTGGLVLDVLAEIRASGNAEKMR
jgi:hypothetical protein